MTRVNMCGVGAVWSFFQTKADWRVRMTVHRARLADREASTCPARWIMYFHSSCPCGEAKSPLKPLARAAFDFERDVKVRHASHTVGS